MRCQWRPKHLHISAEECSSINIPDPKGAPSESFNKFTSEI